jgi:hypothetical protein
MDKTKTEIEDLKQYPVRFIRAGQSAERPVQGEKLGSIYFDKDTKKLKIWDGNSWVSFTGA